MIYGATGTSIYNNTLDGVNKDQSGGVELMQLTSGTTTASSNLLMNGTSNTVTVTGAVSVASDYNLFWSDNAPFYSDGRAPAHDQNLNPLLASPAAVAIDWDETMIWNRTLDVSSVLAAYRAKYTPQPGSPVFNSGDPAFGTGNFIGAIGNGTMMTDLFGR